MDTQEIIEELYDMLDRLDRIMQEDPVVDNPFATKDLSKAIRHIEQAIEELKGGTTMDFFEETFED